MPAWTNDPTVAIQQLIPGIWAYSAGSRPNTANVKYTITQDQISSNVATLTVIVNEGNIPAVNDTLYVYATANSSGAFNTTAGVPITGVSINATTGIGTLTYALVHGNQVATADVGYAISVPAEVPEVSTPNGGYVALALPHRAPTNAPNPSVSIYVNYPSAPASIKWALQAAIRNVAAEYVDIITNETAGGTFSDSGAPGSAATQLWSGAWNFVRYADTGSSGGTNPTVIARILIG